VLESRYSEGGFPCPLWAGDDRLGVVQLRSRQLEHRMEAVVVANLEAYHRRCAEFQWNLPAVYNVGGHVSGRHAASRKDIALIVLGLDEKIRHYSYNDLDICSNRLANRLRAANLSKGDRVAVILPPSFEAAVAHIASLKAGLVVVPLFTGSTAASLEMRLRDSGAKMVMANQKSLDTIDKIRYTLDELSVEVVILLDDLDRTRDLLGAETEAASSFFDPVKTGPHDPAFLAFTSGSEGNPKGVLHAHRQILSALTCFELRTRAPRQSELTWSPADWGWLMGLNIALGEWHSGASILVQEGLVFDPGAAMKLMADFGVQHATMAPTALRLIHKTDTRRYHPQLSTLSTGGEAVGTDVFDWARDRFGIPIHEFYGMSECPGFIGNGDIVEVRRGAMGVALPGHDVQIVDDGGNILPTGEVGYIAIRRTDPGLFLGYWEHGRLTPPNYSGSFYVTSDLAQKDAEGYFWYAGRDDDIIKSAGYRIGPADIEQCATTHPEVELAGAVALQDPVVGHVIKLWIKLKSPDRGSGALKADLQAYLRQRLAAYQWPRHVEFIDKMPVTASGKISRRDLREMN
jgi:acetyl-CoA synthetase